MSTILVIDNKPEHLKFACEILQKSGYSIIETWNAGDAIRIAKEEQPKLILMEIQLPGLDGQTTTRLLRSNSLTRHIKIVAQSSIEQIHQREKLIALGVNEFLSKPYEADALIKIIKNLLAEENSIEKRPLHDKKINNPYIPPTPATPF